MVLLHAFFLWTVRDRIARGDPDFTVYYTAGRILRLGLGPHLYDPSTQRIVQQQFTSNSDLRQGPLPYLHPAFEALIFLPLTFLSYRKAFWVWNVINLGLLFIAMRVMRSFLSCMRQVSIFDLILFDLTFFPIFANFHQGQDAILLLLVAALAVRAVNRNAKFVGGCWIGLAMFKYHLILPLVLLIALWKGGKFLLGFIGATGVTMLLSVALVGWHGMSQYPGYVWHVISQPGFGRIPFRQLPNLLGLMTGWPYLENLGRPLHLLVLACSAGLLMLVARLRVAIDGGGPLKLGLAAAIIAALLVGYSTNTYDLSFLILSAALVAEYGWLDLRNQATQRFSLILPAIPLLISPLWFFLWMKWARMNLIALFLLWWLYAIRKEVLRTRNSRVLEVSAAANSVDN